MGKRAQKRASRAGSPKTAFAMTTRFPDRPSLTRTGLALVMILLIGCSAQNPARPNLTFVEVQKGGTNGVAGLRGVWSLAISPDGKHLYAVAYWDFTVAVFGHDEITGKLTFIEAHKQGIGGVEGVGPPCSVAVSPDGRTVYVAGHWDHTVKVFSRDKHSGKLIFVEEQRDGVGDVSGLYLINWVTTSPDGKHVYTASYRTYKANSPVVGAMAVFERDPITGKLSFVEAHQDDLRDKDGLPHGAFSVTVSPDGDYVYAAGYVDSTLVVYRRDTTTGKLVFVEAVRNNVGDVDGLEYPAFVAPSPDGRHVYVASTGDHAIAVFRRDRTTGMLAFVEVQRDDVDGVDGLRGAHSVAVSPNGKYVYGTGSTEHAMAVFSRDETTGKLTFVAAQHDGIDGVEGLQRPSCVIVSPDQNGKHIYVAGNSVQSVSVFSMPDTR